MNQDVQKDTQMNLWNGFNLAHHTSFPYGDKTLVIAVYILDEGQSFITCPSYKQSHSETRSIDKFNMALKVKERDAVEIKEIMNFYGVNISKNGETLHTCACPNTLRRIYLKYGAEKFQETIALVSKTWPKGGSALSQNILSGVAEFITKYNEYNATTFVKKLSPKDPKKIIEESRNQPKGYNLCDVLLRYYNMRNKNQIARRTR